MHPIAFKEEFFLTFMQGSMSLSARNLKFSLES